MTDENMNVMSLLKLGDVSTDYRTLMDIVYDKLRDDILCGRLPPDTPLNASELALQMNVSRTPVREAINKLTSIGLVSKISHREAKVASFMGDEIHEIYYIRAALEGLAAKTAAKTISQEKKEQLMALAEESARLAEEGDNETFMENNYKFHHLIYESIKTPLIHALIKQFYVITQQYRTIGFGLKNRDHVVSQEHMLLARCIYEGDEVNAERYGMLHHQNTVKIIDENYGTGK